MTAFHRDLAAARFIPPITMGPRFAALANRAEPRGMRVPEDLLINDVLVPSASGAADVPIRVYRPRALRRAAPALLWLHGGGMILGDHLQSEHDLVAFARTLGITVVTVRYRLAPQHPAPAALEDAYTALLWLTANADARGVDADRIAIGGESAGAGLAAGVALMAHDRAEVRLAFQLMQYPMLDDRTTQRTDLDTTNVRVWTPASNRYGWTSYLGAALGTDGVSPYAAPARREDLTGLPPTWIGVGSLDLFFEEDVRYAERLGAAGVATELTVIDGAFHGFNRIFPRAAVSRAFWRTQVQALDRALFPVK